jgi:hypothetical protein
MHRGETGGEMSARIKLGEVSGQTEENFTDVVMTLLSAAMSDLDMPPEKMPRLDRLTRRKFAWVYGTMQFDITIAGPYPTS